MKLWSLNEKSSALVSSFDDDIDPLYQQRLRELGFDAGCEILCLRKTPFGGPRVFQIGDSVFSLAQELAKKVNIEEKTA